VSAASSPTAAAAGAPAPSGTVSARPVLLSRVAWVSAAIVVVLFVVIALVMPHDNAGVTFGGKDQIGTAVLGLLIASGVLILARPRLVADATGVRARSFLGNYRHIPWDVVVGVEFPSTARFGRLVLPGEEIVALYAVQRVDKERSVAVMRGLRALFAASRTPRDQTAGGQSAQ
jgi:hypothetical protein